MAPVRFDNFVVDDLFAYSDDNLYLNSMNDKYSFVGRVQILQPVAGNHMVAFYINGTHDEDHRRAEWPQCFPGQDIASIAAWDIVCREINAFSPHDSKQRRSSEAAVNVVH
jgi:hypothetical protein